MDASKLTTRSVEVINAASTLAVNEGNPVVRSAPKSAPADKLRVLGALVFGGLLGPSSTNGAETKKDRRGLFGRR